ncbi:MAG: hypothetical protein AB1637_07265 [Elusimicrobiota bacterium]
MNEELKNESPKNYKKHLYVFLFFLFLTAAASFFLPSVLNIQERQVERTVLAFFGIFLSLFLFWLRKS